jgi:hypothetical protein
VISILYVALLVLVLERVYRFLRSRERSLGRPGTLNYRASAKLVLGLLAVVVAFAWLGFAVVYLAVIVLVLEAVYQYLRR